MICSSGVLGRSCSAGCCGHFRPLRAPLSPAGLASRTRFPILIHGFVGFLPHHIRLLRAWVWPDGPRGRSESVCSYGNCVSECCHNLRGKTIERGMSSIQDHNANIHGRHEYRKNGDQGILTHGANRTRSSMCLWLLASRYIFRHSQRHSITRIK